MCWRLPARSHSEHLVKYLGKPPYRESDAPTIMQAAVRGGHVSARPAGNNRSFRDFAEDMSVWTRTA